ncbi:Oxygen sensor histidine kinase NreB [Mariniblastus fucicola]|uniref:Oxygen sensor histidine kinase NreB n=2 Tax=Mariniblastus fucicola TaxID=980251 RepID=A0A5B9PD51_9BACT|nr:Oxygen sensor histidine kinase NreB [Mariniblastus fucicola]
MWVVALVTWLLAVFLAVIYLQERSKEWQLRSEQSKYRLELAQEIVSRNLDRVRADLLFVAKLPTVKSANKKTPESLRETEAGFAAFLASQKTYSQIRLIDRKGMEVVRVDWNGSEANVVPVRDLQDKAERYYVSDSLSLEPGEMFTSEFDLNEEQGEIERPLRPVIRFVTPVPDSGQPGNLLVFNYEGSDLLRELASISLPGRTYLVRNDGQFLLAPTSQSAWGWILGHHQNFESVFKGLSLASISEDQVVQTPHGCFSARQLAPESRGSGFSNVPPGLRLVSHFSVEETFVRSRQLLYWLLALGGVMLVPLALVTRFWAAAIDRRELQNQRVADSEKRLRELSSRLVNLQEDERRAISREIHDSLGQQATAINLNLRLLKGNLNADSEPQLEMLIDESEQLLSHLHGFATRVRPAELDDIGLKEAVQSHIWDFESRTGIDCEFRWNVVDLKVDETIEENVFRLVQESLNNIAKHAQAKLASVELKFEESENGSELQLIILDDGVGLKADSGASGNTGDEQATASGSSGRLGMLGMKERVELLGGRIDVTTRNTGGAAIKIEIPVKDSRR